MLGQRLTTALKAANTLVPFPEDIYLPVGAEKKPEQVQSADAQDQTTSEAKDANAAPAQSGPRWPNISGSFSHIFYDALTNATFRFGEEKEVMSIDVAFSFPNPDTNRKQINFNRFFSSQKLLRDRKVPDDFNQSYIYFDSTGRKIALKGQEFLVYTHAKSHTMTLETARNLMMDAVLAVYDLHICDLVHRDIKAENFLLFQSADGNLYLKQIDHDTVREVNKRRGNRLIGRPDSAGTVECYPPEMKESLPNDRNKFYIPEAAGQDLKAVDLYCLGDFFENDITRVLAEQKDRQMVTETFKCLLDETPAKRGKIDDLLNNEFFGATPELRAQRFAERRKIAGKPLFIDGQRFQPVGVDNPLYVLDKSIRPLYQTGCELARALTEIEQMPEQDKTAAIAKVQEKMTSLKQTAAVAAAGKFKNYVTLLTTSAEQDVAEIDPPSKKLLRALSLALIEFKKENLIPTVLKFAECKASSELAEAQNLCLETCGSDHPEQLVKQYLSAEEKADAPKQFKRLLKLQLAKLPEDLLRQLSLLELAQEKQSVATPGLQHQA